MMFLFVTFGFICILKENNAILQRDDGKMRVRRFGGPMGGGGPFHGGAGPMGGMFMGPHTPGGPGPSNGGPNPLGQGSAMFTDQGFRCVQREIVCPKWCLVEDSRGCRSCPCGPGGGVLGATSGGPSGGTSGSGPVVGRPGPLSQLLAGMFGGSSGVSGFQQTSSAANGAATAGTQTYTGSGGSLSINNYVGVDGSSSINTDRPVHECKATLLCTSTCRRYQLAGTAANGCRACTCPTSHYVTTTTIQYIVQPTATECSSTARCMSTCHGGYVMATTDGQGCPHCSCLQVSKPYQPPIEIAVEPPPYTDQVPTTSVTCRVGPCALGCSVGYKCGTDGCPTCDCIHPTEVGLTPGTPVIVARPPSCTAHIACAATCSTGYSCGPDGCPSCQCLGASQLTYEKRPVYAVPRLEPNYEIISCYSVRTCAERCPHGYELVSRGGSCPECRCQPAPGYSFSSSGCGSGCADTGGRVVYVTGRSLSKTT